MNALPRPRGAGLRASLDVLIAYDHINSGKHAKELCDRLGEQLAAGCEIHVKLWKFAVLHFPGAMQAAAREAARAALVIIAANGEEDLPLPVKSWIRLWADHKEGDGGALVAQFHGIARVVKELAPAHAYLSQIARNAGLDFFSQVIESAPDDIGRWIAAIDERACKRTAVLDAILQRR
jgi:hypothetical protein